MHTEFDVESLLYQAARRGWIDESLYPAPTTNCPDPFDYHILEGTRDELVAKTAEVVKAAGGTKTWRELIETVMEQLSYNGQGVRKLAFDHSLDGEVVQAMTAVWLLSAARTRGLFGWEDIKIKPNAHGPFERTKPSGPIHAGGSTKHRPPREHPRPPQ